MRMFDSTKINRSSFNYYSRLAKLERFVEDHVSEAIPLKRAAAVAGMEATYFSKFFHAKTGVCYKDWIAYRRVIVAKRLIRSQNLSLTRVSDLVGFNDFGTFERAFRKCSGMAPFAYKKQIRPS